MLIIKVNHSCSVIPIRLCWWPGIWLRTIHKILMILMWTWRRTWRGWEASSPSWWGTTRYRQLRMRPRSRRRSFKFIHTTSCRSSSSTRVHWSRTLIPYPRLRVSCPRSRFWIRSSTWISIWGRRCWITSSWRCSRSPTTSTDSRSRRYSRSSNRTRWRRINVSI